MGAWPFARKVAVTLSFDDVAPVCTAAGVDYGGNLSGQLVRRFDDLISNFPYLKLTHFVVPSLAYDSITRCRIGPVSVASDAAAEWRRWLKGHVHASRLEVAMHGLYHYNPVRRSAAEFDGLDLATTERVMNHALQLFSCAKLRVAGFRPPGWALGLDDACLLAAKNLRLQYVAASGVGVGLNRYRRRVSHIFPSMYKGIINIPQNLVLGLPWSITRRVVSTAFKRGGIISIKGHFVDSSRMAAGFDAANTIWLRRLLDSLASMKNELWFATHEEIAQFWQARLHVKLVHEHGSVWRLEYSGESTLFGLTLWFAAPERRAAPDDGTSPYLIIDVLRPGQAVQLHLDRGTGPGRGPGPARGG